MTPDRWTNAVPPSLDDILRLAQSAWARMPAPLRQAAGAVLFRIEDFAAADILRELGVEDPFELSGLYQGVDLLQRSAADGPSEAAIVFLYREPILDEWIARGDVTLGELVEHVLIHEIGHHFGFTDNGMDYVQRD